MEERVRVIYKPFDCDFRGVTLCRFEDGENYYTIVINENLCEEIQYQVFRHEIAHIAHRDFDSPMPVGDIERTRHMQVL